MADLKITELQALTIVNDEDLLAIVSDPTGTAVTKKIRVDAFQDTFIGIGARVYNSGDLSIEDNTTTALTFNSERYDTDAIHDTGSNTGRLTATTAGIYVISATVHFAADNDGFRGLFIREGGDTVIAAHQQDSVQGDVTYMTISTIWSFAAAEYVECLVYHNAGAATNVVFSSSFSPEFMMQRIG